MKTLPFVLVVLAITRAFAAADEDSPAPVTPRLGREFGKIIEVEGRIVDDAGTELRARPARNLLEVYSVGDVKRIKPAIIELAVFSFAKTEIPDRGTWVRLRGYETGAFTGIPANAFKDVPRVGAESYRFARSFQITKVLTPKKAQ